MMTGAITGASPTPAPSRAVASREDFLRLLAAELTMQNPLEPLSNAELMQQFVGLQQLEQTGELTDGMRGFQRFLQMSSGSSMIGRSVRGMTEAGEVVEGVVSRVVLEGGSVNVVVGDQTLPLDAVTEIRPA